jgi:epoxyqueuosine reductase
MTRRLQEWARIRGYQVAWGPVSVLDIARADIERRKAPGETDPAFARENLVFDVERTRSDPRVHAVVVVVKPRPAHVVAFVTGGARVEAVMPPTYERYRPTFEEVRADLAEHVLAGALVLQIDAPLKTLACRLGLVRYGRNNLAYAASIGSYMQILGYATDVVLPIAPDWQPREPALLDECAECGVCEASCPSGAIGGDRVLLHAERCLTLANETPGPWPSWVSPQMHRCLIGCLECQRRCPANPQLPVADSRVVFDEEETSVLLAGSEREGPVWSRIRARLNALGQPYQEEVLGRNLRALLEARGPDFTSAAVTGQRGRAAHVHV